MITRVQSAISASRAREAAHRMMRELARRDDRAPRDRSADVRRAVLTLDRRT
jgi:hypothetical protein